MVGFLGDELADSNGATKNLARRLFAQTASIFRAARQI